MPRKKTSKKAKTSKKTTKASKKTYQTHGKVETPKASSLEQIWGDDGSSLYGTLDVVDYKNQLREMTRADIQTHATRLSVVPVENREMLERRLVKEFEKHAASFNRPEPSAPTNLSKESLKILSEGR